MPRLTARPPSYRHHKPSGQAVVTLDGRDCYLGPFGSAASREKYHELVGRWQLRQTSPAASTPPPRDDLTLNELFLRYWAHAETYYRKHGEPTTEQRMIRSTMRYLLSAFGSMAVTEFGPLDLKAVRQGMVEKGLGRVYVNQSVGRVRRMFRWAVENELAPAAALHALSAVAGLRRGRSEALESPPVLPASESVVEGAIPFMSKGVVAMVRLQMATGMRPGEALAVRPMDVDRSLDPWVYTPGSHKTEHHGRARRVYLGPKAQVILAPFLLRPSEAWCFSPAEAVAERRAERSATRRTPLSCGNRPGSKRRSQPKRTAGERYSVDSYRRAIDRACERAFPPPVVLTDEGMPAWRQQHRFHPHQLRHNAATFLAKAYGIEAAQVVLGHATLSVTGIYAERDFAKAAAIMRQVG